MLLRAYQRVYGMFALAPWDAPQQRLVLARDRRGKKPLLWTQLPDGALAFASEPKALLRLPQLARELDLRALNAYLSLQYMPGPETALCGVHRRRPAACSCSRAGAWASIRTGGSSRSAYGAPDSWALSYALVALHAVNLLPYVAVGFPVLHAHTAGLRRHGNRSSA